MVLTTFAAQMKMVSMNKKIFKGCFNFSIYF